MADRAARLTAGCRALPAAPLPQARKNPGRLVGAPGSVNSREIPALYRRCWFGSGCLCFSFLYFEFFDDEGVLLLADGLDGRFLGNLGRGRLENHLLGVGLVSLGDLDVFLEVGDDDAIKLFERRTDVRLAARSCDATHRDLIRARLRIFGDAQLNHAQRQEREGGCEEFIHGF